jgi:hypothetical protein
MKVNGQDYSQYVEKNVRNHKPDRIFSIWTHAHTLPKANGRDIPIPRPASEMGGFCMLHQYSKSIVLLFGSLEKSSDDPHDPMQCGFHSEPTFVDSIPQR